MAGKTIVFFPKYTCLVGTSSGDDYYSDPYDVTSYKSISVEALVIAVAASAVVDVQMEESSDMITWSNLGSAMAALTPGTPSLADHTSPARYIRAKVTVTATNGVATLWVKGVARDS